MRRAALLRGLVAAVIAVGALSIPTPANAASACTTGRIRFHYTGPGPVYTDLYFVASGCWWSEIYVSGTYGTGLTVSNSNGENVAKMSWTSGYSGSNPTTFRGDFYRTTGMQWHPRFTLRYGGTWCCSDAGGSSQTLAGCYYF